MRRSLLTTSMLICMCLTLSLRAQEGPGAPPVKLLKEKISVFEMMDGQWRGSAWQMSSSGKMEMTQTERVGPMLDGTIRVIEGKGYDEDGEARFNAFAVISYDPATDSYQMRSYAQGRQGDFEIKPLENGFTWSIPAGPATIRYTATIKDGVWNETGERVIEGQEPFKFFEMNLKRIGDTDWPAGDAVAPK